MGLIRGARSIARTAMQKDQVTIEVYQARLAACGRCEYRFTDEEGRSRCGCCNCFILPKAQDKNETCPILRW